MHQRITVEGKNRFVQATKYLTFSVHMDGDEDTTIFRMPRRNFRDGVAGIKEAVNRGFR